MSIIAFRWQKIDFFDAKKVFFLLWIFLLVFPKGGFKIGGLPVTWGYALLMMTAFFGLFKKQWKIHLPRKELLFCLFPFQIISFLTIASNGYEELGMTLSFFLSFFLLPLAFLLMFSHDIETLDLGVLFDLIKKGVFFVTCYGIFLFIFKQTTGKFIEIPFLTINWDDLGELENKNINRGFVFKLISTYNNGNIYGICILMLLPLYCYLEKSKWRRTAVKTSLFLTFSRTVWAGLLFHELCYDLFVLKNRKFFILKILFSIILFGAILTGISFYYGLASDFFFDRSLGGRSGQFDSLYEFQFFSKEPFGGIYEMVYLGMIHSFGIFGLLAYLFSIASPIFFGAMKKPLTRTRICLILGLTNYLFVCFSDGALLFIPTMAFFWFLASLIARRNIEEML